MRVTILHWWIIAFTMNDPSGDRRDQRRDMYYKTMSYKTGQARWSALSFISKTN